ncbi:MAG: hypothetical protein ACLFUV_05925 [Methanomassiliicoccales archaeon]
MMGPKVRLSNGVELHDGETFYFDPLELRHRGVHCISHAHFDHLPQKVMGDRVVCSELTHRSLCHRIDRTVERVEHSRVRSLDAGHIDGSNMFLVEGETRTLFTGDFCNRDRFGIRGARPERVDTLIIESTFGAPRYRFPPPEEELKRVRDWVDENMSRGRSVVLISYPLGKTQETIMMFEDLQPFLYGSALHVTQRVDERGLSYRPFDRGLGGPSLIIWPTGSRRSRLLAEMKDWGAVTAVLSGWAMDPSYRYRMGVDEAFTISDHADYQGLLDFVRDCDPSLVYTHHGFEGELASAVRKELGVEAYALKPNQNSLLDY